MRTIALNVFVVLLLLSLDLGVMSGSSCRIKTNGCSVPGGLPFIYKKTFTPACNKHDVCYYCGDRWGWKRSKCDKTFKEDMYKLCEKEFGRRKRWLGVVFDKVKRCKTLGANMYYHAVIIAGRWYWSKPSPIWCEETCAKNHGDPFKPLPINS